MDGWMEVVVVVGDGYGVRIGIGRDGGFCSNQQGSVEN